MKCSRFGQAVVLLNDGEAEFYNIGRYIGENVKKVGVGDLNNHGIPDIFIGRPNSQTTLYMNNGYGQFVLSSSVFPENEIKEVCIEDFNDDGWQHPQCRCLCNIEA